MLTMKCLSFCQCLACARALSGWCHDFGWDDHWPEPMEWVFVSTPPWRTDGQGALVWLVDGCPLILTWQEKTCQKIFLGGVFIYYTTFLQTSLNCEQKQNLKDWCVFTFLHGSLIKLRESGLGLIGWRGKMRSLVVWERDPAQCGLAVFPDCLWWCLTSPLCVQPSIYSNFVPASDSPSDGWKESM